MSAYARFVESANSALDPVAKFLLGHRVAIGRVLVVSAFLSLPLVFVHATLGPTGSAAFFFLWFILFIPILAKVFGWKVFAAMIPLRKELGILMGTLALVHAATYFVAPAVRDTPIGTAAHAVSGFFEESSHDETPASESRDSESGLRAPVPDSAEPAVSERIGHGDRARRSVEKGELPREMNFRDPLSLADPAFWMGKHGMTFLAFGMVAALFSALLLATSNAFSVKAMGWKRWKFLQRSAYLLLVFVVGHVVVLEYAKGGEFEFGPIVLLAAYLGLKTLEWKGVNLAK